MTLDKKHPISYVSLITKLMTAAHDPREGLLQYIKKNV